MPSGEYVGEIVTSYLEQELFDAKQEGDVEKARILQVQLDEAEHDIAQLLKGDPTPVLCRVCNDHPEVTSPITTCPECGNEIFNCQPVDGNVNCYKLEGYDGHGNKLDDEEEE